MKCEPVKEVTDSYKTTGESLHVSKTFPSLIYMHAFRDQFGGKLREL